MLDWQIDAAHARIGISQTIYSNVSPVIADVALSI